MKVGERTAELIKMNVGSALTELENPPEDYIVHGPNPHEKVNETSHFVSGLPDQERELVDIFQGHGRAAGH